MVKVVDYIMNLYWLRKLLSGLLKGFKNKRNHVENGPNFSYFFISLHAGDTGFSPDSSSLDTIDFSEQLFKGSSVNTLSFKYSMTHCRMRSSIIYSKVPHEALFVNQAIRRQHLVVISTTVDTWSLQPVKYEAVKWKWDLCSVPLLVPNKVQWQRLSGAELN